MRMAASLVGKFGADVYCALNSSVWELSNSSACIQVRVSALSVSYGIVAAPLLREDARETQGRDANELHVAEPGVAIAAAAIPAFAHHFFAMFDTETKMTLEDTVKQFQWAKRLSWILLTVSDAEGLPEQ
jgi:hypothetical protein